VAGVALASRPAREGEREPTAPSTRGVGWALLAATGYGVGSWVQGRFAVPALGAFVPVWLYYATGVVVLVGGARRAQQSLGLPDIADWLSVFGAGLCSTAAYTAFALGLASGRIAEVSVLSTLSSGIAALLGFAVLGERLARHQWLGVVAILVGIALINAGR
jgi:drug/metabolite transporter (DMT)-like permease